MDHSRPASSGTGARRISRTDHVPADEQNTTWPVRTTSRTSRLYTTRSQTGFARPRGPPSVRLRRLPSSTSIPLNEPAASNRQSAQPQHDDAYQQRRRSSSEPQRPVLRSLASGDARRQEPTPTRMPTLNEEASQPRSPDMLAVPSNRRRAASDAASSVAEVVLGRPRRSSSVTSRARAGQQRADYEREVVDLLDVIDPEVSALTTLNNVQNSLFVPNLGRYLSRQPTYDLSRSPTTQTQRPRPPSRIPTEDGPQDLELEKRKTADASSIFGAPMGPSHSISSVLTDSHYAVLPHGVVLEGWSDEDKDELNDHVRHLLHSRKAKFRRSMRAFGKYVRTPLGAFVTIYSFLITFWGTAWVLFIIGWLSVEGRQKYFIEICDQVLTALFAVVGIGLAPFRAVDTYHMIYVAKYHFKTLRLRREQRLPDLKDENDLPELSPEGDVEAHPALPEDAVLSDEEQKKFHHHQAKFLKSHTFYRPHETMTHHAFPIRLLIQVVVLLDCHSIFQMALGGTTWGIYYKHRPKALTAVILTCSICCNIAGGITIKVGDSKTRKKEVVERIFRQALTEEALEKMEKKRVQPSGEEGALTHRHEDEKENDGPIAEKPAL